VHQSKKVPKAQVTCMKERNNSALKYATPSDPYMLPVTDHEDALDFLRIQDSPSTDSPTHHLQDPDCWFKKKQNS